jgi:hypothetical protein
MKSNFAKVRRADKPDAKRDRLQSPVFDPGELASTVSAAQPMIVANEEPHDDHHHYRL